MDQGNAPADATSSAGASRVPARTILSSKLGHAPGAIQSGDFELFVAEVDDEFEGSAQRGDERLRTSWVATSRFSIWEIPATVTPIRVAIWSWVRPRRLRVSARAPAAGLVEHGADRAVEDVLATGGVHGSLAVVGVPPTLNVAHRRSPSAVP